MKVEGASPLFFCMHVTDCANARLWPESDHWIVSLLNDSSRGANRAKTDICSKLTSINYYFTRL